MLKMTEKQCVNYLKVLKPEGDKLKYAWDWDGDLYVDEWTKMYDSNENVTVSHIWDRRGNYEIRVRVADMHGWYSDWSDPLSIRIPRTRNTINSLLFQLFEQLLDRFPLAFPILRFMFYLN